MTLPDLPPAADLEGSPSDRPPAEPAPLAARPSREAIDTRLVRRLADILKDTDLSEIEVERGDLKIRVARQSALAAAPALLAPAPLLAAAAPLHAPPLAPTAAASPAAAAQPQGETMRGEQVKSPMVGTVYLQPQPGAKRFADVGDTVTAGQTLLIIEAMKTMNPVPAPRAGTISRLLVEDGQPVEFGEPLVVIE